MDWDGLAGFAQRLFGFDPNSPLLFTQFYFWAFFALVYAVFALIGDRRLLRNAFLFFVSLFFYYKTSGLSVLILVFVTCSDFLIARRIAASGRPGRRKAWLVLSICIDLLLLCYFKYAYFFADFVHSLTGLEMRVVNVFGAVGNALAGTELFRVDRIVLPVGISFFTFQVISYTVDVYRGQVKPVDNILDFGFYVSFFPQLVAGPIVRASEFIPQLYKPFSLGRRQFGIAVFWILNGLAKKLILSDYIAVNFVDRVFGNPLLYTGFENLAALFGYSLQVYADFSGYTDIAIGVAMLMGFYLPQNFNSPYKASNPQDFWRRWHMSL
ncbi:MAG: MBOAT family protein, partial [Bacteroidales bacterium]|nr:MBOAT family protein [Bacteroidales bacterium]